MTSPVVFIREIQDELKKVIWPSRAEITRLTIIVIGISIFVGIYIGGLDFLFTKIVEFILK